MHRFVALALALLGLVVPSAAAQADNPVLTATVGTNDTYTISLVDASGNPVQHLDPGTYTIQVRDRSSIHQFHLFGPGVDQATSVDGTGTFTWTVTFQDGKYTFQCDPHASVMHGTFTVGTISTPPTLNLAATVGPRRTIALRDDTGARVTTLTGPATAIIGVNDRTKGDNFHLTGPGVNKATGVGFRGRVTWHVNLRVGKYVYRSDRHKTLRGSFTVASS